MSISGLSITATMPLITSVKSVSYTHLHGLKDTLVFFSKLGIDAKNIDFDTAIAAYLLEPSRRSYDIEGLAADFLHITLEESDEGGTRCV